MFRYEDSADTGDTSPVKQNRSKYDSRTFLGIILVLLGSVLIARNYGWLDSEFTSMILSWPMILIAIGLFNLVRRSYTSALVLILIGLFFLVDFPESLRENFWPALIVLVGISFILQWHRSPGKKEHNIGEGFEKERRETIDYLDETAIFGGKNISVVSERFQGGKITSIFGGTKLNLLNAKPVPGCVIDVANIFGGTKIAVPEDWNIKFEVVSIFGGFDDKRSASVIAGTGSGKVVVIKGTSIFGGGEISSTL